VVRGLAALLALAGCTARGAPPASPPTAEVVAYAERACWRGDAAACYALSTELVVDRACWTELVHHACRLGDRRACAEAAGTDRSLGAAGDRCLAPAGPDLRYERDRRDACRRDDPSACHELATIRIALRGDPTCSHRLADHACGLGDQTACRERAAQAEAACRPGADFSAAWCGWMTSPPVEIEVCLYGA
jgi:hypothetical protein